MKEKLGIDINYMNSKIALSPEDENDIGLSHRSSPTIFFNTKINERLSIEIGEAIKWLYSIPALSKFLDSKNNTDWLTYMKSFGAKSNKDFYTRSINISLTKLDNNTINLHLLKSTGKYFINFDEPKEFTCAFETKLMGEKILEVIEIGKKLMGVE